MTPAPDIAAIEARANAATPGPWTATEDAYMGWNGWITMRPLTCGGDLDGAEEADIEFICHAREDIPSLLSRVRELEEAMQGFAVYGWRLERDGVPDETVVSAGMWSEPRPTMVPGIDLPEFRADLRYTAADFKRVGKLIPYQPKTDPAPQQEQPR